MSIKWFAQVDCLNYQYTPEEIGIDQATGIADLMDASAYATPTATAHGIRREQRAAYQEKRAQVELSGAHLPMLPGDH